MPSVETKVKQLAPKLPKMSEVDSNPRSAFDAYTLSRRASSTTRASLHKMDG